MHVMPLKLIIFCMEHNDIDINLYANINGGLCGFSYVVIQLKHFFVIPEHSASMVGLVIKLFK